MKTVPLGELCTVQIGRTPKRAVARYWGGDLPWVAISDLGSKRKVTDPKERITHIGAAESNSKLITSGTLLLSFKLSLGKRAFAGVDLYTNEAIAGLLDLDLLRVDPNYLYWALGAVDYESLVDRAAKGRTLNKEKVESLPVPLPPLPEQKRIAAILDAADALRAKRRESIEQLDKLVRSVFLEMFGDPVSNSLSFPTATLGDLGIWKSGGTPPRKRTDYFTGRIPWFSSGELDRMIVTDSAERICPAAIAETSVKPVPAGALMLGMYDTAALKAAIAGVPCACNQAVAFAVLNQKLVDTRYVFFAILVGREHFRRRQRGVRQKNLNLSMVRQVTLPLPPKDIQDRFAIRLQEIEGLRRPYNEHLTQLDTLFASLQSRAFRGEL